MKRLLAWTGALVAILAATVSGALLAVRVVGALNPLPAAAILDRGSCQQPCWDGIQPGRTTRSQAEALLRQGDKPVSAIDDSMSDVMLYWNIKAEPPWRAIAFREHTLSADTAISFVELKPPTGALHLGDAIVIFGRPLVATLCWRFDSLPDKTPRPFLGAHVYFKDNIEILAYNPAQPRQFRYDPAMVIWSVLYNYPADEPAYRFDAPHWRGFTHADGDQQTC